MPEPEAAENTQNTPAPAPAQAEEAPSPPGPAPVARPSIGRLDGVPDGTNVQVNVPLEYDENAPVHEVAEGDFGTKMWGDVLCYQCHYCPWDTPENVNGELIGLERMIKHIAQAHPIAPGGDRGPAKYDDIGERIRTK